MTTLKPLATVGPSQSIQAQPAVLRQARPASPVRQRPAISADTFKGTKFGAGLGAAISVPIGLGTLITSGMPGLAARVPGRLLIAAGITAGCAVLFGGAGAVASQAKTQRGAALSAAAVGAAVVGIATGIATRNVGMAAFGSFAGGMVAGIIGNGVGEHLGRPE